MSRSGSVRLYAEFLLNISQVTIFATLDLRGKDGSDETALFSSDRKRISIAYAGETAAITYPNGISGTAVVHLPIKAAAQLSLRLEISEKGDPYWKHALETLNDSPWAAHSFSPATVLACRGCGAVFCDAGRVRAWKDLPRGDWAETMDLWHCHKPTEGSEPHSHHGKAYDRAGSPTPGSGIAFVDSSDIILARTDAGSLKIIDTVTSRGLHCEQCGKAIGRSNKDVDGSFRLHKWNLTIKKHKAADWETNDIQSLLCVQLLELADSQASKRFLLESPASESPAKVFLIWVLNPDLKYCASYVENGHPRRAMKVLYKDIDKDSFDADEHHIDSNLQLPHDVLAEIRHDLEKSNEMLPPAVRMVQGWTAGLLDRSTLCSTPNKPEETLVMRAHLMLLVQHDSQLLPAC